MEETEIKKKKQWKKPTYHKTNQDEPSTNSAVKQPHPLQEQYFVSTLPVTFPNSLPVASTVVKTIPSVWISVGLFVSNNLPVIMVVPLETLKFEAFQKSEDMPPQPDNLHRCLPAFLFTKIRLTAGTGDSLYGSQRCQRERERLLIHAKEKERVAVVIERGRESKRKS